MFIPAELLPIVEAAPKKDPRKVLQGVSINLAEDHYRLTATDGKRLIRMRISAEQAGEPVTGEFIVPIFGWKQMEEACKSAEGVFLTPPTEDGRIMQAEAVSENGEKVEVAFNVIEGKYPNAQYVIDQAKENVADEVALDAKLLLSILKTLAKLVGGERNRQIIFGVPKDPSRPIYFRTDDSWLEAIVMPLKVTRWANDEEAEESTETPAEAKEEALAPA